MVNGHGHDSNRLRSSFQVMFCKDEKKLTVSGEIEVLGAMDALDLPRQSAGPQASQPAERSPTRTQCTTIYQIENSIKMIGILLQIM